MDWNQQSRAGGRTTTAQRTSDGGSPGKRTRTQALAPGKKPPPPLFGTLAWFRAWVAGPPSPRSTTAGGPGADVTLQQLLDLGFVRGQGGWLIHPRGHMVFWQQVKGPDPVLEKMRADADACDARTEALEALDRQRVALEAEHGSMEYELVLAQELAEADALEAVLTGKMAAAVTARAQVRPENQDELDGLITRLENDLERVQRIREVARAIDDWNNQGRPSASGDSPGGDPDQDLGPGVVPDLPTLPDLPALPALPDVDVPGMPDIPGVGIPDDPGSGGGPDAPQVEPGDAGGSTPDPPE